MHKNIYSPICIILPPIFTRPKPVLNPSKPYYEESANNTC